MARWFVSMALSATAVVSGDAGQAQMAPPACAESAQCAMQELRFLVAQNERIRRLQQEATQDPQLDAVLTFNEQAQASLRDWFAANAALAMANDRLAAADQRLRALEGMKADVTDAEALESLTGAEKSARDGLARASKDLAESRREKWKAFGLRRNAVVALVLPSDPPGGNTTSPSVQSDPSESTAIAVDEECSLATAAARAKLNPNTCAADGARLAPALSAGALTIPGRPLEQRGIFTSVTGSKDGTSLSLRLADEFKWRSYGPPEDDLFRQRVVTLGVSGAVKSDGGDLLSFAPEKDGEALGALDRLSSKASISGTLSLNFFPVESAQSFAARGARVYAEARKACLEDQAKSSIMSVCEGSPLIAWMLARDTNGAYVHPVHAEAFSNLYYGSHEKHARSGIGVSLEYARPGFSFIDTAAVSRDEMGELLAAGVKQKRHDTWALTVFAYWRLPEQAQSIDLTVVPSLTYKDTWEKPDEALFCPPIDTSAPFTTAGCKTLGIAPPKRVTTVVPGAEVRMVLRGFQLSRFLGPEVALAPKMTWDTEDDRWGLDIPLYFAIGGDKTLSAGLKSSWEWGGENADGTSRDAEWRLSIMVGKAFSLNP